MKNLKTISKKYKTTKKMMGYIDIYEKYLAEYKNKIITIFEIGVEDGESLRMFSDYFKKAKLIGLDIVKKDFKIKDINQADFGKSQRSITEYCPPNFHLA